MVLQLGNGSKQEAHDQAKIRVTAGTLLATAARVGDSGSHMLVCRKEQCESRRLYFIQTVGPTSRRWYHGLDAVAVSTNVHGERTIIPAWSAQMENYDEVWRLRRST